jgi:maltooligosyltrehalose trehalohydrolase
VRRFFLENALMWFERFHVDALRLDAVHSIIDRSAKPFLEELADEVHRQAERHGRHWYLIAESDLNDPRIVRSSALGGHGLDAMWCDDFHHAAHVLLTGEKAGYYADYGRLEDMARAFRSAMSSPGEWSEFRQRRHGRPGPDLKPQHCVVFMQNHDQVGNRLLGERLDALIDFERQKLAAGITCLSQFIPLLFMGQEYGETAPFQYFINHGDEALVEAVRRGRREEFASFAEGGEAPDPAARETTERCVLDPELRSVGRHAVLHRLYEALLELRKTISSAAPDDCLAFEGRRVLLVQRAGVAWMVFSFSEAAHQIALPLPPGRWRRLVASADVEWEGPGCRAPAVIDSAGEVTLELPPHSFVVYGPAPAV